MTTTQDYLEGFTVDAHGHIRSPGKFEGAPAYAVWFYQAWGDGLADEEGSDADGAWAIFELGASDWQGFPELKRFPRLLIEESPTGYVSAYPMSRAEAAEIVDMAERQAADEE